jgi:hypothetical protein
MQKELKAARRQRLIFILTVFVLGSCNFFKTPVPEEDPGLRLTAAVETIYAGLTNTAISAALSATATLTETVIPPTETPVPATATPTLTFTPFFSATPSITPTATITQRSNCLKAEVTKTNRSWNTSTVQQRQFLVKQWTVLNIGECPWTTDFTIVHWNGTLFQPLPAVKNFHQPVEPGGFFIITFEFKAPEEIGQYQSRWMMRSPTGQFFGIGVSDTPLYIELNVKQAAEDDD